jgi:hypothetical protein
VTVDVREYLHLTAATPDNGPALDDVAMRRFHLDAVALQREYPELLGTRRLTACPHAHTTSPNRTRGTLAAFTHVNPARTTT